MEENLVFLYVYVTCPLFHWLNISEVKMLNSCFHKAKVIQVVFVNRIMS